MDNKTLAQRRITYSSRPFNRKDLPFTPLPLFQQWLAEAADAKIMEPNAMTLATATPDGIPSARLVLLKGVDSGFVFFTNYESFKGQQLAANPKAALVFYWDVIFRQVRIRGTVTKVSEAESAAYFHSRPRGSQIGASVSQQSAPLGRRHHLEGELAQFEKAALGKGVPLPAHWGGYRVKPQIIEFWQGRPSRLHDRFRYTHQGEDNWTVERLYP